MRKKEICWNCLIFMILDFQKQRFSTYKSVFPLNQSMIHLELPPTCNFDRFKDFAKTRRAQEAISSALVLVPCLTPRQAFSTWLWVNLKTKPPPQRLLWKAPSKNATGRSLIGTGGRRTLNCFGLLLTGCSLREATTLAAVWNSKWDLPSKMNKYATILAAVWNSRWDLPSKMTLFRLF